MKQELAKIAIVVKDYDEAINFYVEKLNFELIEDTTMTPEKRWVVIAPPGSTACKILLAKAKNDTELAAVGNQTGGRVFLFLHTDNLDRDYDSLTARGIKIARKPITESWGKVLVFEDLYGNLWDLIEPPKLS